MRTICAWRFAVRSRLLPRKAQKPTAAPEKDVAH